MIDQVKKTFKRFSNEIFYFSLLGVCVLFTFSLESIAGDVGSMNKVLLLFIQSVMILFSLVSTIVNKPEIPILPNGFLQLNNYYRKWGLDLAWYFGSRTVTRDKTNVGLMKSLSYSFLFISLLLFLVSWLRIASLSLNVALNASLISTLAIIVAFKLVSKVLEIEHKQTGMIVFENRLKTLCAEYVIENCKFWLHEVELRIRDLAKKEIQSNPEKEFLLVSYSPSTSATEMPPTSVEFTSLYSNGFLSSVTNILFNVKDTTYTLVNSNIPTYDINESRYWGIEEYHFKDVTEVNYEPANLNNSSIVSNNVEYRSEGFLILSLNNSTKKSYPATKSRSSEFIEYVRSKVRESKLKEN